MHTDPPCAANTVVRPPEAWRTRSAEKPFSWSDEVRDIAADIGVLVVRVRLVAQAGLAGRSGWLDDRGVSAGTGATHVAGQTSGGPNISLAVLESTIRVNPLRSVGVAILAGAIIGAVALRR